MIGKTILHYEILSKLGESGMGEVDEAFAYIELSYQEHFGHPFFLKIAPNADPLRSDPRYAPFLKKLGLEP